MKKFIVTTTSGRLSVDADVVRFEPGHVTFWTSGVEKDSSGCWMDTDVLVVALHNPAVESVREETDDGS